MKVSFSIIIPLYNKTNHILEALSSVQDQNYDSWECIVVNDGSTDDGAQKVRSLNDNRIRCIDQNNQGVGSARNKAAREAKNEYLAFLDADDRWEPCHLETLAHLIQQYPKALLYFTYYNFERNGKRILARWNALPSQSTGIVPNYFRSILNGDQLAMTSASAISRITFNSVGGFDIHQRTYEDQSLWAELAMRGPIAFSRKLTAFYKLDTEEMLTSPRPLLKEVPFITNLQKALDQNEIHLEWRNDVKGIIASNLLGHAGANVLASRPDLAHKFLADPRTALFPKRRFYWKIMATLPNGLAKYIFRWNQNRKGAR